MELWLDAQISPIISNWIRSEFSLPCFALRDFNLLSASDIVVFRHAKTKGNVVIITKDEDFLNLLYTLHAPPRIIWLTFGNCSNAIMKEILKRELPKALSLLEENDLVEISA